MLANLLSAHDTRKKGFRVCRCLVLLLVFALSCACSSRNTTPQEMDTQENAAAENASEDSSKKDLEVPVDALPYSVDFVVVGKKGKEDWEDPAYLADKMKGLSQLVHLKKKLPDGEMGLNLRAQEDVKTAVKLMQSEGFYDGSADFVVSGLETKKAKVVINLHPGQRYPVGDVTILYSPTPLVPQEVQGKATDLFPEKKIAGIEQGKPATASLILEKIAAIPTALREKGYPDAKLSEQHFYLDKEKRLLNLVVVIDTGAPATLGRVIVKGKSEVDSEYIARLAPWKPGEELWDAKRVDEYISTLRKTGLFKNVTPIVVASAEANGAKTAQRPVAVSVEDAKHKTFSVFARYDTDTGAGLELGWEHRNLFHHGEKLTVTAPISLKEKGIKVNFEKPEFFSPSQKLLFSGSAIQEISEAYDKESLNLSGGIERRWNKSWYLYGGLLTDVGWMKENSGSRQGYSVYGGELKGRYDSRSNTINPVSGVHIQLAAKPLYGEYNGDFSALGSVLSFAGYYSPFKKAEGGPNDSLVLAGKIEAGSLTGAPLRSIPSPHRYFLGGAGSVRGYGYQQIGPTDKEGEPLGGRSYQFVNLESRFKLTDSLGFVTFVDGGMVYKEEYPTFEDMRWGAGLGFRYFTPIGPIRFDVAAPLHQEDPPIQFYISIGHAF